MNRLTIVVLLCIDLMGSAMAADAGNAAQGPVSAESATTTTAPAASAASAVPAATAQPSNVLETTEPQANPPVSKSAIPLEKRKGGDVTKCLELGSNQEIAACAEKYR
ncbi:MAG TPA: hypothetical protein VKG67_00800 [Gallionellaceae bacterium]|nr:hypothetical protein [Gallionellaceae bacterium]